MKKYFLYILATFCCTNVFTQEKVVKDIDFDSINDTIYFDKDNRVIISQLSSMNFKPVHSLPIDGLEYADNYYIKESKNGFEFAIEFGRYGVASQFKYEKRTKRLRLVGMRRRESDINWYGANGSSSVNLLTNKYIGNWQYNDKEQSEQWVEMPVIKSKMYFFKTYLEDFDETVYNDYDNRCISLFVKYKNIHKDKFKK